MKERPILFSSETRWIRAAAGRLRCSPEEYAAALNRGEKLCGGCRKTLPRETNFGVESRTFDGRRSRCHECVSAKKQEHYKRTFHEQRPRRLAYARARRPQLYAYNAKWQRDRNARLRGEMFAAYGERCACCGESERIFLDLDHVRNNGAAHRRELGNQAQVMLALRAAGWPKDDFQILCCNCNQGKARNGGVCPHAKNRS